MYSFGISEICLNGHLQTSQSNNVEILEPFCSMCGEKIINCCPECEKNIKGQLREISQIKPPFRYSNAQYTIPLFCNNCGIAFPWTKQYRNLTFDLIDLSDNLDDKEKGELKENFEYILINSPKSPTAIIKFKKLMVKAGNEISGAIRKIMIDILSEAVKKTIWE